MPWVSTHQSKRNFSNFLHFSWFLVQTRFVIKESRVNFLGVLSKTTTHIVVQDTKLFRAKSENWRIKLGRIGINSLLSIIALKARLQKTWSLQVVCNVFFVLLVGQLSLGSSWKSSFDWFTGRAMQTLREPSSLPLPENEMSKLFFISVQCPCRVTLLTLTSWVKVASPYLGLYFVCIFAFLWNIKMQKLLA